MTTEKKYLNAAELKNLLISMMPGLLSDWLPGGRILGHEYKCGNKYGGPGDSMSVNVYTGIWKDFADSAKGGDLISLYAAINSVSDKESIRLLNSRYGSYKTNITRAVATVKDKPKKIPCTTDEFPSMIADFGNWKGKPTEYYIYTNENNNPVSIVGRYYPNNSTDKKILPWVYTDKGWIKGAQDHPRYLYNLTDLLKYPDKKVLIVEGERKANDAINTFKSATVTTWQGGSAAVKYTDFSPLFGRKVVIWPDNDAAGLQAYEELLKILIPKCPSIELILDKSKPQSYDFSDALKEYGTQGLSSFISENKMTIKFPPPDAVQPEISVTSTSEPIPTRNAMVMASDLNLQVDGKMMPVHNTSNVYTILSSLPEFRDLIYYDEFKNTYMTKWNSDKPRQWSESDDRAITILLQNKYGLPKIQKHIVIDAVLNLGDSRKIHPLKDWLETLKWDQIPRAQYLFSNYCGAENNDYSQAVSLNFLISLIARIYNPGCKADNMVILEGPQGIRKSTFFKTLVTQEYFSESSGDLNSKDFIINCQGKWLIEMAELTSLNKKDANDIKKLLSTAVDNFRPPYGRTNQEYARQFIFCGSTNDDSYLNDPTGARRFWPVKCSNINLDAVTRDREQILAEAVHRFKDNETWWNVPTSALDYQDDCRMSDIWEDAVYNYVESKRFLEVRRDDIFQNCLMLDIGKVTKMDQMRLANVMKVLGFEKIKKMKNAQRTYIFKKTRLDSQNDEKIEKTREIFNHATQQFQELKF